MFRAKMADDVKHNRMTRLCFKYDRTLFSDVIRHVFFGENKVVVNNEIDVRVTVFTGVYGLTLFTVTAVCPHESHYLYITAMLKTLDPGGDLIVDESTMIGQNDLMSDAPGGRQNVITSTGIMKGVEIVEAVVQEGSGSQYLYKKHRTRYSGKLSEHKLNDYVDAVHRAVAFSPTPILPDVKILSTTSWIAENGVGRVKVKMSLYSFA